MKSLFIVIIFLLVNLGMFFLLSLIGLLWFNTYKEIITSPDWFILYQMFLGIWVSIVICHEIWSIQWELE